MASLDVTGDARGDLVVFIAHDSSQQSVVAFDLPPGRDQPVMLLREAAALDGCHTVDEVRDRLPLSRGLTPAAMRGGTLASIVGRLSFSNAEQLRQLVARGGLHLCGVTIDADGRHEECRTLGPGTLTDAVMSRDIAPILMRFVNQSDHTFDCENTRAPRCTSVENAGGSRYEIAFARTAGSLRITRLTSIDDRLRGE